jgi:hypothetical protein
MKMFREVFRAQWKWTGGVALLCAAAAFAIPILSIQNTNIQSTPETADRLSQIAALEFLTVMQRWSPLYTILAAVLGLAAATLAWAADHRGRHVYALVLPVERWRFVFMRYSSGALIVLLPVLCLLAGALLATRSISLPEGLYAYPFALTVRFALAALVAYSLFFAISAGTTKTALVVLTPVAVLLVADLVLATTGTSMNLTGRSMDFLLTWPGVLEVFTGRWLLVDV